MIKDAEVFNLYKYFIWADKMRAAYDDLLNRGPEWIFSRTRFEIESNLYMSYWFGSLYVVIEGWEELGLKDKEIDLLLGSPNVKLLRRYRNGVFHFQRDYFDERFMGFLRDGINRISWIRSLHKEFERYMFQWVDEHRGFL